jgi:hypothetical protein
MLQKILFIDSINVIRESVGLEEFNYKVTINTNYCEIEVYGFDD